MKDQIFINGRGLITGAGNSVLENWTRFCESGSAVELKNFGPVSELQESTHQSIAKLRSQKFLKLADTNTLLGVLAAEQALKEAAITQTLITDSMAVIAGTSRGPQNTLEKEILSFHQKSIQAEKWTAPQSIMGVTSSSIAQYLNAQGPTLTISTSCTSGLHAIGVAMSMLKSGFAETALAGGVELITELGINQFQSLGAYSTKRQTPYPYRPMSDDRSGTVFGSGAGFVFLSTTPSPTTKAKLLGFGAASEVSSPTGLSQNAHSLQLAINRCLKNSNLNISDIDLVIGHGSGTADGESAELKAYEEIFQSNPPLFSYNKWLTGHLIAAAGPLSVILATEHFHKSYIPKHPYISSTQPLGKEYFKNLKTILVTALGFGGNAVALLMENYD